MECQIPMFSLINNGPTCSPCSVKAPIKTAVVLSPGIPSDKSGTRAPPVNPLFAASEAITPSGAPLPSFDGSFEKFFCWV